jgi:hypothetical protein
MTIKIGGKIVSVNYPKELHVVHVNKGDGTEVNNTTLTLTPTTTELKFTPELPYTGYGEVTLRPVTSNIDLNIKPENIKSGVSILGVDGIYEPNLKPLNVTTNGRYFPEVGFDGFSSVTVNVSGGGSGSSDEVVSAFLNKTITDLNIPYDVPTIKNYSFVGNNELTLNATSSLEEIEPHAFSGATVHLNYNEHYLFYEGPVFKENRATLLDEEPDGFARIALDPDYLASKISNWRSEFNVELEIFDSVRISMGRLEDMLVFPDDGESFVDFKLLTYPTVEYEEAMQEFVLMSANEEVPPHYSEMVVILEGVIKCTAFNGMRTLRFFSIKDEPFYATVNNFSLPDYFANRGWFAINSAGEELPNYTKIYSSGTINLYNKDFVSQKVNYNLKNEFDTVACFPKEEDGYHFTVIGENSNVIPEITYEKATFNNTNEVVVHPNTTCRFKVNERGYTVIDKEFVVDEDKHVTFEMTPSVTENIVLSGDFNSPYTEDVLSNQYVTVENNELKVFIPTEVRHTATTSYIKFIVPNDGNSHSVSVRARVVSGGSWCGALMCCTPTKFVGTYTHFVSYPDPPAGAFFSSDEDVSEQTFTVRVNPGVNYITIFLAKYANYASPELYISEISFSAEEPYSGRITVNGEPV